MLRSTGKHALPYVHIWLPRKLQLPLLGKERSRDSVRGRVVVRKP